MNLPPEHYNPAVLLSQINTLREAAQKMRAEIEDQRNSMLDLIALAEGNIKSAEWKEEVIADAKRILYHT